MLRHPSAAAAAALVLGAHAHAQWTYTIMNPPGQPSAGANFINAGSLAGFQGPVGTPRATIWTSYNPSSAVDVNPPNASQSQISRTVGTQSVGNAVIGGVRQAALWQGTVFSSLHPAGFALSYANDIDGANQYGFARENSGIDHAYKWSGTAASGTTIDPPGTRASRIYKAAAGRQVGSVEYPPPDLGNRKAGYWSGTAASFVLLPESADTIASEAMAISPDGQSMAGYVQLSSRPFNTAALWQNGVTRIDLNPAGHSSSGVSGMDAQFECGDANPGSGPRAALWQGSAASFFDLSTVLPSIYTTSDAFDVYSTNTDVWVCGYAYNTGTSFFQAILWHNTIPAPSGASVLFVASACALRRRRS
jgi:hypothetical protein